jgi:hypothetical protein
MGWFNKKQEEDKNNLPLLPELPKLPELPELKEKTNIPKTRLHQLPSFPTNSLGEKFSQNNIKEAIIGRKEYEKNPDIDFIPKKNSIHMMQKPQRKQLTREIDSSKEETIPEEFKEAAKKVKSAEPIFIRIDKFEESLKIFNKTKEKISEIEKMLTNIKKIKEEEEKELETWRNEIQTMKAQIERVDKDIFSKIE